MKLLFAGCARNCASTLEANIKALLSIADEQFCDELSIYIAENNSFDETRDIIVSMSKFDSRIIPVLLEDLDIKFPIREARIAYCRDQLLDTITRSHSHGLYIPIDLDSQIACSLNMQAFKEACQLVSAGICTAVFPSACPFYYDIHALRHSEWCPESSWKQVVDTKAVGSFWNLLAYIRFISSKQRPHTDLCSYRFLPVDSAFGGIGIYCLCKVVDAEAHYYSNILNFEKLQLCEHVVFNSFLQNLYIYPRFCIEAPKEHLSYRLLSTPQKVIKIMKAVYIDLRRILIFLLLHINRSNTH